MKSTHILILLFFNFTSIIMPAQVMSIGLSTGTTFYQGDVSERSLIHLKDYNLAFGGFIKFQLNNRISIRANFLKGRISGRDKIYTQIPWRMKRGFQFQSPIDRKSVV